MLDQSADRAGKIDEAARDAGRRLCDRPTDAPDRARDQSALVHTGVPGELVGDVLSLLFDPVACRLSCLFRKALENAGNVVEEPRIFVLAIGDLRIETRCRVGIAE